MHIPDGVLSLPVLIGGGLVTATGLAIALPKVTEAALPRVAVLSATFFVASLIAVPVGPTSVHLVLSTLMGLVLGWAVIPAVFIGLALQAVVFGFGGLATLGVTTSIIALPGLVMASLATPLLRQTSRAPLRAAIAGTAAALAIIASGLCVIAVLGLTDVHYLKAAPLTFLTFLPLAAGEGLITGFAVAFLARVRPEALGLAEPRHA